MNCRINKQREWASRILLETVTHPHLAWFVTLTYKDEELPVTVDYELTLAKKPTLKWINNLPRTVGPFRYYIVGEYGDESGRPHYHMAVFPEHDSQVRQITAQWSKGFTSAYPITPERAAYLAGYTTKKLTSHTDERLGRDQEPEFRTSSKNPPLAHAFVSTLVSSYSQPAGQKIIEERGDIEKSWRYGSRIYPLPKYVIRKARARLGIPALHRDRLIHNGYYAIHSGEEFAAWEPEIAAVQEEQINAKKKAVKNRYNTKTI